jgi:phosphohistidine phosphatase
VTPAAQGPRALLVMRHGKSDWTQDGMEDFDRPLSRRGLDDARRMGRFLARAGLKPDVLIASPAARTRRTARILARRAKGRPPIIWEPSLYGAEADAYVTVLKGLEESVSVPLLVGHNPALEQLTSILTGGSVQLPTGAMLMLHTGTELAPLGRWSDLAPGSCALAWLLTPRLLRAFL